MFMSKLAIYGGLASAVVIAGLSYKIYAIQNELDARDATIRVISEELGISRQAHATEAANHQQTQAQFLGYVESMTTETQAVQEATNELNRLYNEAREQASQLASKLSKHDFSQLAREKPGLIGNRINAATNRVWRKFGDSTSRPNTSNPSDSSQTPSATNESGAP